MASKKNNTSALIVLAVMLTLVIFTADVLTPLGIAWGFLYIIVVLITLWIPGKNSTFAFTAVGIILTVLGFYLSPPGVVVYIAMTNRLLSISGIAITMFGILKYKEKENIVHKQKEELEKLAHDLKNSNSDLEQFAYVASHDLQEPLRKIQSFGDRILSNEKQNLSEQGKDHFSRMMNASERMQTLINDLLSFSRLTTKAEPFAPVDLNELLKEVLSDMEVTVEKTHAKIDSQNLPVIKADSTQMRQLFQNLISNGIKFRRDDVNPVVKIYSANMKTPQSPEKEYVNIYFEDNGTGFDEKYSEKIFNIFQRLEGKKYEGSGIGLAVCKKIALRHGGNISVQSKIGKGTTFIVSLPINHSAKYNSIFPS